MDYTSFSSDYKSEEIFLSLESSLKVSLLVESQGMVCGLLHIKHRCCGGAIKDLEL